MGFHGRMQNDRLVDLGVIWLDTINRKCWEKLPEQYLDWVPSDQEAYDNLSDETKEKGMEVEALMTFHSLQEAKKKQQDVRKKLDDAIDLLEEEQEYLLQKIYQTP